MLFTRITFYTIGNLDVINEKKLDAKLITVNDYAVEIDITKQMFTRYKEEWK